MRLKLIYIILFLLIPVFCFATNREVGSGKTYSTIQAGVNAASSGDTVLVYDGTYQEDVDVSTSNITIQSVTEWGAILDGNSGTLAQAFVITAASVRIIGFKIQNYALTGADTGVIDNDNPDNVEIKYNWLTSNNLSQSNGAAVYVRYSTSAIIRGNKFSNNSVTSGADTSSLNVGGCTSSIIELNQFSDSDSDIYYNLYLRGYSHYSIVRYNFFQYRPNRFRQSHDFDIYHNIFQHYTQLHDQSPEDISDEGHEVYRNTFYNSSEDGLWLVRQDNDDIHDNLFLSNNVGISDYYGASSGILITDNNQYNNATWLEDFDPGDYTESGTTNSDPSYNSSTGACGGSACNPGADLLLTAWPFTTQVSGSLQTDYPYGGGDSTPPELSSATISTNGTTLTLVFSEAVTRGGSYENADWDLDCSSGNDIGISYVSGDDSNTLIYTISQTIYNDETCDIDFSGDLNSIEDISVFGNDLKTINSDPVVNGSTQLNPASTAIEGMRLQ